MRLHSLQRLLGLNLLRANPRIAGYNVTVRLDHGYTGEGIWTFWREWKPGVVDAFQDGFAPLRWCLFVAPLHHEPKPSALRQVRDAMVDCIFNQRLQ